jgi:hypothetical protein
MHRLVFVRVAFQHGWSRVRHPAENLSLALTLLAAFGLPTTFGCCKTRELPHFLEIRTAARPPVPERPSNARPNFAQRISGLDPLLEPDDQDDRAAREAADVRDRETVSQYIAKFARPGEALFDALVQRGTLVGRDLDRDVVRSPRTCGQIGKAVGVIEMGEWGDLRWNPA